MYPFAKSMDTNFYVTSCIAAYCVRNCLLPLGNDWNPATEHLDATFRINVGHKFTMKGAIDITASIVRLD